MHSRFLHSGQHQKQEGGWVNGTVKIGLFLAVFTLGVKKQQKTCRFQTYKYVNNYANSAKSNDDHELKSKY